MQYRVILALICLAAGRNGGRSLDRQYRDSEGQPHLVTVPEKLRWCFALDDTRRPAVREALWFQVLSYGCALLALVMGKWWVLYAYGILGFAITTPMALRYNANLRRHYDMDWVIQLRRSLSMFPVRRCRVLRQLEDGCWEIAMGRRRFRARASVPVEPGQRCYGVHSYDHGSPWWTLREHP